MTGSWGEFIAAFMLFLLSHRIPTQPGVKAALTARIGAHGFTLAYSLVSLALLVWLIVAAGRAPFVPLWDQAIWQRWAVNLVMPVAVLLAVFGIGAPNPLSFGGQQAGFDPAHPGIAGVVRHPLLWALALWSGAHLLVNGDLAHVLLFGSFAGFALLGQPLIDRRNQRLMGAEVWQTLTRNTSDWPFAALLGGRWRPVAAPSLARLAASIAIWALLFSLHAPVIGVLPNP
jgi:uncharacterized membrane protein